MCTVQVQSQFRAVHSILLFVLTHGAHICTGIRICLPPVNSTSRVPFEQKTKNSNRFLQICGCAQTIDLVTTITTIVRRQGALDTHMSTFSCEVCLYHSLTILFHLRALCTICSYRPCIRRHSFATIPAHSFRGLPMRLTYREVVGVSWPGIKVSFRR